MISLSAVAFLTVAFGRKQAFPATVGRKAVVFSGDYVS